MGRKTREKEVWYRQFFIILSYIQFLRYALLDAKPSYAMQNYLDVVQQRFGHEEVRFGGRVTSGTAVFHSFLYNAATASIFKYIGYCESGMTSCINYGEAQVFFTVSNFVSAVVKKFNVVQSSCILRAPPPEDASLLCLYEERLYGSFYPIVTQTEELEVISVTDITGEAVLLTCFDTVAVTDVLPFEHD